MDKSYVTGFSEDIIWLCYIVVLLDMYSVAHIYSPELKLFGPEIFVKQG
jgi:hypothetical protein